MSSSSSSSSKDIGKMITEKDDTGTVTTTMLQLQQQEEVDDNHEEKQMQYNNESHTTTHKRPKKNRFPKALKSNVSTSISTSNTPLNNNNNNPTIVTLSLPSEATNSTADDTTTIISQSQQENHQHQQTKQDTDSDKIVRSILKKIPKYSTTMSNTGGTSINSTNQQQAIPISTTSSSNNVSINETTITSSNCTIIPTQVSVTSPHVLFDKTTTDNTTTTNNNTVFFHHQQEEQQLQNNEVIDNEGNENPTEMTQIVAAVQNIVIEKPRQKSISRRRQQQQSQRKQEHTVSIEGYIPATATAAVATSTTTTVTSYNSNEIDEENNMKRIENKVNDNGNRQVENYIDTNDTDDDNDKPLIFNSLSDLMKMAGTLPDDVDHPTATTITNIKPGSLIETEMKFQYMSHEEYQTDVYAKQYQQQQEIFLGQTNIFHPTKKKHTVSILDNPNHDNNTIQDNDDTVDTLEPDNVDEDEQPVNDWDDDDDDHNENDEYTDDDDDDDNINNNIGNGGLLELLGFGGQNDDEDDDDDDNCNNVTPQPERMFLKVWKALSEWVTPEAVSYVQYLQQQHDRNNNQYNDPNDEKKDNTNNDNNEMMSDWTMIPINQSLNSSNNLVTGKNTIIPTSSTNNINNTDLASSRCFGLMLILKQHIQRCLYDELLLIQQPKNDVGNHKKTFPTRRECEMKLSNLVRCFNYTIPCPIEFDTITAQVVTCILIDTVLCITRSSIHHPQIQIQASDSASTATNNTTTTSTTSTLTGIPTVCSKIGMLPEEYRYLTQSAIINFGTSYSN
jgi:hypothetical protein